MPNPSTFPFKSFSFDVPSQSSIMNFHQFDEGTDSNAINSVDTLSLTPSELDLALQYSPSKGIPALHDWICRFHDSVHHIPYSDWDVCISTGSQDLITRTFDSILEDGDSIIIEAPTYSGTLSYLKARDINILSVDMDAEGMIPDQLEDLLSSSMNSMNSSTRSRIKMLYTIPTAQNPSGSSYSLLRKKEIYDIACKYNVLLFEDDPYYFLDFDHMEPSQPRAVSFQSMDTESRVIRSDSLSKNLSSGLRMGYLSGHSSIIRNIELNLQSTCLHSSGLSQMVTYKLLTHWDGDGSNGAPVLQQHLSNVCRFYFERKKLFGDILEKYLKGKCEWEEPRGGMFHWMKVLGVEDTESLIKQKAKDAKVLLLPGKVFYADQRAEKCAFVRAAYSVATEQDMDEGIKRFANILNDL